MTATQSSPDVALRRTPLHALHVARGGKLVPFAGYEMPVQYPTGILAEHLHTRSKAGLFDVSHMGQAFLRADDHERVARALEQLVPGDIMGLKPGQVRYTVLLGADGGILDDLMVMRPFEVDREGTLFLVVNAATKADDFAHIGAALAGQARLELLEDAALLALQGPAAHSVLERRCPGVAQLKFMHGAGFSFGDAAVHVTRSGYTGEDGFEISVPADRAVAVAEGLLAEAEVLPIGLGARDSLRLEAGLCLYGHDIDRATSPVEAGLSWVIGKRRREAGDFPGASRILKELAEGPARCRVGLKPDGKAPAREGTAIADKTGREVGCITSGGFSPTLGAPIAMGYVARAAAADGTPLDVLVRGAPRPAKVVPMPFVPHRYAR